MPLVEWPIVRLPSLLPRSLWLCSPLPPPLLGEEKDAWARVPMSTENERSVSRLQVRDGPLFVRFNCREENFSRKSAGLWTWEEVSERSRLPSSSSWRNDFMGRTCPVRVRGRFGFAWIGFGLDIPGIGSRKQDSGYGAREGLRGLQQKCGVSWGWPARREGVEPVAIVFNTSVAEEWHEVHKGCWGLNFPSLNLYYSMAMKKS